jgi:hypothetical protein
MKAAGISDSEICSLLDVSLDELSNWLGQNWFFLFATYFFHYFHVFIWNVYIFDQHPFFPFQSVLF